MIRVKFAERTEAMNIQAKKLVLIEELLRISDENVISKLESIIKEEKNKIREKDLKPMPLEDFHKMIDHAIQDSEEGRVIAHDDLKKKIKTWK
jgi:hypothetical protein